ncbi:MULTISPECIES: DUF4126 family protein [unclassified Chelatococcus]|uniref:DUF4126 family protein n=1 Tax=unclassified Chelatococcus TaxID=2638111 RepID=UPI001BCEA281|nr:MULTISPECIES: DUF4126 family protein [unclassified Chelatococcus]MBS7700115.1 DUF4126 family protein [Chelatococcus sp. YT9]MBX3556808.1 DUF4126 family protein [Chelatococcus sp.]
MLYLLALLIGVIAGLRAMTAPAAIAWAVYLGWLDLSATPLAFMGYAWTPWIFTVLALVELIADQLPSTPSRTVPVQFGTRVVVGALCGACVGAAGGNLAVGAACGALGAVVGTLGGRSVRRSLAASFGKDPPAAFIEDAVAIIGAVLIVVVLR